MPEVICCHFNKCQNNNCFHNNWHTGEPCRKKISPRGILCSKIGNIKDPVYCMTEEEIEEELKVLEKLCQIQK